MPFTEKFVVSGENGTALASSTTATSIIPASRKITLPAYFFDRVGKRLRFRAAGRMGTVVTTPGTLSFFLRFGSTDVFATGAINLNTTAQTNASWILDGTLTCQSIGQSTNATVLGIAEFKSRALVGSAAVAAGGVGVIVLPDTAPAVGTGFDSTTSQAVDLFAQWSVSNASNTIRCDQFEVESDT